MKLFFLFLVMPLLIHGALFKADLSSSAERIEENSTFNITLHLAYPKEFVPDYKALREHLLRNDDFPKPPFTLLSELQIEKSEGEETRQYQLRANTKGPQYLSFFTIPFLSTDKQESLLSEIVLLEVIEAPAVKIPIAPFAPMNFTTYYNLELSSGNKNFYLTPPEEQLAQTNRHIWRSHSFPWILVASFLVLAVIAVIAKRPMQERYARWKKQRENRSRLEEISLLITKGEMTPFFSLDELRELRRLLKNHIARVHGIAISSLTGREIAEFARKMQLPEELQKSIDVFFVRSEAALYAHAKLPPEERQKFFLHAKKIINLAPSI